MKKKYEDFGVEKTLELKQERAELHKKIKLVLSETEKIKYQKTIKEINSLLNSRARRILIAKKSIKKWKARLTFLNS